MKKFTAIVLSVLFILAAASMTVLPTAAAGEGDWVTSRSATDYEDEFSYCPAAGYEYTSEGFVTISPDYTNRNIYQQMHTRNAVDLRADNDGNGHSVSMRFTIMDFPYDGGEMKDEWIALTLNSQPIAAQGTLDNGEGICILFRGSGDGHAQMQPFYVDNEGGKSFSMISSVGFPNLVVEMDEYGREVYTFTIRYDNSGNYVFNVCGFEFYDDYLNTLLDRACSDGAYVGLTLQSGVNGASASACINEWQGQVPFGNDSAEPEENLDHPAPIADPSTVPTNQPAVLWDSTFRDFRKLHIAGADYDINEDGTIAMKIQTYVPYIVFSPSPDVSYEASDFPVIAVLTKNCWANSGLLYYSSGPDLSAGADRMESFDIAEYMYVDGWQLGFIDLTDYYDWSGRINSLRVDFVFSSEDVNDDDYNKFDVAFIAAFRSHDEALNYTDEYLWSMGVQPDDTTEEETTQDWNEETTEDYPWYEETTRDWYEETTRDSYEDTEYPWYEYPTDDVTISPEIEIDTWFERVTGEYNEEQDGGISDLPFFGNGLIGELLGSDLLSGCGSVIASPALILIALVGVVFMTKKKD